MHLVRNPLRCRLISPQTIFWQTFCLTDNDQEKPTSIDFHFGDADMSGISELAQDETLKTAVTRSDPENQLNSPFILYEPLPIIKKKSLGAGVCQFFPISAKN